MKSAAAYVALLRGVNVGKSIRVPMPELKARLEALGLVDVVTYLNSGNVIFGSTVPAGELGGLVEDEIERSFGARVPTLVKSSSEMIAIADSIPADWSSDPTQQTYVAYLFDDVDHPELVSELPIRQEFMSIYYTPGAVVWNIARENYNRSHITKIAGHSAYARMTTRNVNTARKLAQMVAQATPEE